MTTRIVALLLVAGCAPDLSLLSDQASFAGSGTNGDPAPAAGSSNGGASSTGGSMGQIGGEAGDSADVPSAGAPPADGGGGSAGASSKPCVTSGAEICNAKDDDCNGVVDEGCPGGVSTTFSKDLDALGDSPGGAPFTDDCKDGELLGGVDVAMGAFLSQIRGICRSLSLEQSTNAEHGYKVKLSNDRPLTAHPAASTDTQTQLACPEDEALVGLRIGEQYYTFSDHSERPVIARVWLTCAKLVLTETQGKLGVSWVGAKELAPASGAIADGTAWLVSAHAPAGLVASRLLGASGNWVDRVGFGVSSLAVVIK